mgnify:CR=1 FL=1
MVGGGRGPGDDQPQRHAWVQGRNLGISAKRELLYIIYIISPCIPTQHVRCKTAGERRTCVIASHRLASPNTLGPSDVCIQYVPLILLVYVSIYGTAYKGLAFANHQHGLAMGAVPELVSLSISAWSFKVKNGRERLRRRRREPRLVFPVGGRGHVYAGHARTGATCPAHFIPSATLQQTRY